jgi:hypothetical protein
MKNTYVHVAKVYNNRHESDHISGPTEFSKLCEIYMTPSRSSHFLCALSHLERVAHRPKNLLLQPQPPPLPGESVAHRHDNLLLLLRSSTMRKIVSLSKE